jgi:tetratricopeptide (TPR) repeat protein
VNSKSAWIVNAVVAIGVFVSAARAAVNGPGLESLDYAYQFASAIKPFPKDRAKAQEQLIRDYLDAGALSNAVEQTARIETWRRGVAHAEVAVFFARLGKAEEARKQIEQAQAVYERTESWPRGRIAAHIASAHAALGDLDKCKELAGRLAKEEWIKTLLATVQLHAARGESELALAMLQPLEDAREFEFAVARTQGYLALARSTRVSDEQRRTALDKARNSADRIAGWKRFEATEEVLVEFHRRGQTDKAKEILNALEAEAKPAQVEDHLRSSLLVLFARSWAALGDADKARALLNEAKALAPSQEVISKPGAYAAVAAAYASLGDMTEAGRVYEEALASAEKLVNARPRALAVVEICRSMGRQRFDPGAETRARLDALLRGLKDPW